MMLMEERKRKLSAEGACSTSAQAVAAVAAGSDRRCHSPTGAVIRDILYHRQGPVLRAACRCGR